MSHPHYDLTTNFGKWQHFMKDCPSPQIYIDFGFYSMIAAALQRRVWIGDKLNPIFPNIYVIMVGKAGIGKGQVIFPVLDILKHHKYYPHSRATSGGKVNNVTQEELVKMDEMVREAQELQATIVAQQQFSSPVGQGNSKPKEAPLLFPLIEDATTYEALCQFMSLATRAMPVEEYSKAQGKIAKATYVHTSLMIGCEELGTLLREKARDTVNFMLATYNCKDYTYRTKANGTDFIKRGCLNMLGGTTPSFMEQIFTDGLLNEGFGSRTFFVFASSNRFYKFKLADYTTEQLKARQDIIDYVSKLANVYGQVTLSKEAEDFLTHWWEVEQPSNHVWRVNRSPKLDAYYARKNLHVMKLAMIFHFANLEGLTSAGKCNMQVSLHHVQMALHALEHAEKSMHHALNVGGNNPLAPVARKVREFLRQQPSGATKEELLLEFYDDVQGNEMDDIITFLVGSDKINKTLGKDMKGAAVWLHTYNDDKPKSKTTL